MRPCFHATCSHGPARRPPGGVRRGPATASCSRIRPASREEAARRPQPGCGRSRAAQSRRGEAPSPRRGSDAAIGDKPIRAAVKRKHAGRRPPTSRRARRCLPRRDRRDWQPRDRSCLATASSQSPAMKRARARRPRLSALARAQVERGGLMSMPTPRAQRQLGQQREEDAAAPGAEVEQPERRRAAGERPVQPRSASRYPGAGRACSHRCGTAARRTRGSRRCATPARLQAAAPRKPRTSPRRRARAHRRSRRHRLRGVKPAAWQSRSRASSSGVSMLASRSSRATAACA